MSAVSRLKSVLLPRHTTVRRLPFGLSAGIRMNIDFSSETKVFLGLHEVELNKHFRRLCVRGMKSFDVGASVGYDTLIMAKLSHAPVLAIDADAAIEPLFWNNVRANPKLMRHVAFERVAVGAGTGPGLTTLDTLTQRFFAPQFVKIDIEGAEVDALTRATELLRDHRPNLIVETHSALAEARCLDAISDAHYQVTVVQQRRWLRENRPAEHNRWIVAKPR